MIGFIIGVFVGGFTTMVVFALLSVSKEENQFKIENKCCENCVYYDTDRTDQPCCCCVNTCNFEKESEETR
jgi:hypothetical protein